MRKSDFQKLAQRQLLKKIHNEKTKHMEKKSTKINPTDLQNQVDPPPGQDTNFQ
jgi:hypothetical protein